MPAGVGGEKISPVKKNKDAEEQKPDDQPEDIDYHRSDPAAGCFKCNCSDGPEDSRDQGSQLSDMIYMLLHLSAGQPALGILNGFPFPYLKMQFCFLLVGIGMNPADILFRTHLLPFLYHDLLQI